MTTVAIVGTGRMGSAMARALARGGVDLVLHNRSAGRAEALANELGASLAGSPAEAASAADVAITMLADGPAVESTWGGANGLIAGARRGSVLVDMSTVPPETLPALADATRERGAGIVDAPVSGSVHLAEAAQLTIMAGGSAQDLDRARPVLNLVAKQITHVGPLGSGHALKLAVNALIFALNGGVAEALVLAERAGIDRALAYDVFTTSAAGAPYIGYKQAAFVEPDATPVAFSLDLAAKDLRLITALADRLGVPMEQARVNQRLVAEASEHLGPDRDASAVAAHLRDLTKEGALGR
jgi:3-hydroxyisobutyrate dehydrogenase-like beta-hydroxyacid dehydrogenase